MLYVVPVLGSPKKASRVIFFPFDFFLLFLGALLTATIETYITAYRYGSCLPGAASAVLALVDILIFDFIASTCYVPSCRPCARRTRSRECKGQYLILEKLL